MKPPSTKSATAFVKSYHRPPGMALSHRGTLGPTRERWAWFRIAVLRACQHWPRHTATLFEHLSVTHRSTGSRRCSDAARIAWQNLRLLRLGKFLQRDADGYRTTPRGLRVLADLDLLELGVERP